MLAKVGASEDNAPRTMRELIQKKFLEEIIGCSAGWKVLVMDDLATRVISSVLTMYDIMENKVTLVEKLILNRQPFADMDVIYLALPTQQAAQRISDDFSSRSTAKYANVHIFFLENVGNDVFGIIQSNALLISKVKTFKEVYLDFLAVESNIFHFDIPSALEKLYGVQAVHDFPSFLGQKLANFCITLNEHPCIRYQGSSSFSRDIATSLHQTITQYKRANSDWFCYGDDKHNDRERAQILILDRSFDPLSPLMHEYTYQAMTNDLLEVSDGVISYKATTNRGVEEEKQAILNENDEFWLELRHAHIAKVIEVIKERMNDIIQNNAGAQLAKKSGANMDISTMAAAVKSLPEYQQTTTKLAEHVSITTQCMNTFTRQGLINISRVEQTISTGIDEDGKEIKGAKLFQLVAETLQSPMDSSLKMRLLAVFYVSQRNLPGGQDFIRQAFSIARISTTDQQAINNFDRILASTVVPAAVEDKAKSGGMFSSIFGGGKVQKIAATVEGEYTDTRHVCLLRAYLEQLMQASLPQDRFPAMGPAVSTSAKAEAKSVRRFNPTGRFGRKDATQLSGGRYLVFIAGGASYAEMRVIYELMAKEQKECILGTTHFLTPENYLVDVGSLHTPSSNSSAFTAAAGAKRENLL